MSDQVGWSVERDWCKVLVQAEERGRITYSLMHTRLSDVELTERVPVWRKLNAKQIDRVRRYGNDEFEFWAPLGKSGFQGYPNGGGRRLEDHSKGGVYSLRISVTKITAPLERDHWVSQ